MTDTLLSLTGFTSTLSGLFGPEQANEITLEYGSCPAFASVGDRN